MDKLIIATTLFSLMLFTRCESEYQRQMSKAEHMKEMMELKMKRGVPILDSELDMLRQEIELCATVSGSKTIFLEDLYSK